MGTTAGIALNSCRREAFLRFVEDRCGVRRFGSKSSRS
jgi:hypothetical protein